MVTMQANRTSDDARWNAVLQRETLDGDAFFYGVRSTGIFCRPTCPSRRPRRDRVAFFDSALAAVKRGFRPCKRCRPESTSPDLQLIFNVLAVLERSPDSQPSLAEISDDVGVSQSHLQRTFKQLVGVSPTEYWRNLRNSRFRDEVRRGKDVTTSMYDAGYWSSAALYGSSDQEFGMSPATYQRGGEGVAMRCIVGTSPLGWLAMAVTDRGVASIQFANSRAEVNEAIADEFPQADIEFDEAGHPWFEILIDYLSGDLPHPDLPLDVRGTAFQRRVWQAIRVIPPGETRNYAEIALEIGSPSAYRAVANACAANPAVLVIPCHRVVRADGSAGGYRHGAERKSALLKIEAGAGNESQQS